MKRSCTLQPEVHPFATARVRPRGRAVLPIGDYGLLLEHLEICERDRGPNWTLLAYVLQNRIVNTEPSHGPTEGDIVVDGSRVSYSVSGGPVETALLVLQPNAGQCQPGIILAASLLGATLIGMRTGQRAPLLCEDGSVKSLVVVDTVPPQRDVHAVPLP
jgi:hypothetical protein